VEVSGQLDVQAALPLGNSSGIHCIGSWIGHTASLDDFGEEKYLLPLPEFKPWVVHP